jgi:predicted metal-binding membrane protein
MSECFEDAALPGSTPAEGERGFLVTIALLLGGSVLGTIAWCGSMSGGMSMPGDWTMSMAWMRMPDQSWLSAAASFMGMWMVMMVAMMLPALAPMLSRYRRSIQDPAQGDLGRLTALAGSGYFLVWTIWGAIVYPLGVALASASMRWETVSRSVPIATGAVFLMAGFVQLSPWKRIQLRHCRNDLDCARSFSPDARGAVRFGIDLGARCSLCCSGFMMILLAGGVMDLRIMAIIATAINVERLGPKPERVSRVVGVVIVATGGWMLVQGLLNHR